jgi:hypothetical protein
MRIFALYQTLKKRLEAPTKELTKRKTAMAGEKIRMNFQVSPELNEVLDKIADDTGASRSDVIRQALALMKVAHEAKLNGKRMGFVTDPSKLDTEIVGLI